MVVKMKKWSPWQPAPAPPPAAAKYRVKVERIKLEGFEGGGGERVVGMKVRWKGERRHGLAAVGFHRRRAEERRWSERIVRKGEVIEWEEEMENICCFSMDDGEDDQHKFVPWDVSFKLTYGEYKSGKMVVIGKASLNVAELASKMETSIIEKKLPITLEVAGMTTQATISVSLSILAITDPAGQLVDNSTQSEGTTRDREGSKGKERKKQLSLEEVSLSESDESITFDSQVMSESLSRDIVKPEWKRRPGFFNWKRRRLNLRRAKMKGESEDSQLAGSSSPGSMDSGPIQKGSDTWEASEFISRDGEFKLKTHAFFASFDQRSDKAAGPSACTALVTVIAHWLQSHGSTTMPTSQEFDRLIIDGSSEWRNLCENQTHVTEFPDKHFDLETVLRAEIRPVRVSREKSSVGFFGPEKFECLKGVMSFDDIWDHEISQSQGIYIVSWNDHFFVLKTGKDGCYIIDTLGERLFEGCNRAYILKFDEGSCIKTPGENEEAIYGGKECCKEFIKRFLVAIPLKELEIEEQKESVPYYSLHHRLQIEFNFCGMP